MKRVRKVTLPLGMLLIALLVIMAAFMGRASTAGAASVTPTAIEGNPTCVSLGYDFGFKPLSNGVEATGSGEYSDGVLTVVVTVTGGNTISFTSNIGVDAVIVKGGPVANVYTYNPESFGDTGLVTATNNNEPYGLSHFTFCYDIELGVSKTAVTAFDRDFDWSITKDSLEADGATAEDPFEVSENEDALLDYRVVVSKSVAQDRNHAVSGTITVTNPHPTLAAQGVSVTDSITGGINATVDCDAAEDGDQNTGLTIAAGGPPLSCTYTAELSNADARTNTATATTTTVGIGSGTGTAAVSFANTTPTTTDNCANVSDTFTVTGAPSGSICATTTFNYQVTIPSEDLDCGMNEIDNTAAVAATSDQSVLPWSETVYVLKNCPEVGNGCTLTQGYWKNHGDALRKQFDETWNDVGGINATFLHGLSYKTVLDTAPAGNVWYILAHQYIAAKLNELAGADASSDLTAALNLLSMYTPAQAKALKGATGNATKAEFVRLAGLLDAYNNGLTGPGHCSSDPVA